MGCPPPPGSPPAGLQLLLYCRCPHPMMSCHCQPASAVALQYRSQSQNMVMRQLQEHCATLCDSVPFKQWCNQSSQHLRARKWRCAMHRLLRLPCTAPVWDSGLDELSYAPSCCSQGDFAFLPAVPLSPHVHVVGGLTPRPAKQLPPELLRLCEASQPSGVVYVSMGTTAIPGRFVLRTISTTWLRCDPPTSMLA